MGRTGEEVQQPHLGAEEQMDWLHRVREPKRVKTDWTSS